MEPRTSSRGILIGAVIAVLVIAGAIAFVVNNQQAKAPTAEQARPDTTTPNPSETTDEPPAAPSERMTITYRDEGFEPMDITVKKGTTITVKNESSRSVQFSSADHPTHRKNPEMNLKTLAPGESASYSPTEAGTWGYHDHLDESKTGTVTVTE